MRTQTTAGINRRVKRNFGLAIALLVLLTSAAMLPTVQQQPARAAQTDAYFVINVPPRNVEFVIKLTDPVKIQHARNLLSGALTRPSQVQGKIVKQPASYNTPWSFHFDPQTIEFFDSAVEVCDGSIAYVETHLDEAGGAFLPGNFWCPWASRLVREIAPPAGGNQVTSVSAASYRRVSLAEEAIVAAYGANLALATETANQIPLPTVLAGTTVKITDRFGVERFAPLFFVSPTQVNYLVPLETAPGYAMVTITNANGGVVAERTQALNIAPGLFTANADGKGAPAAVVLRIKPDGARLYEPGAQFDPAQNKFVLAPIDLTSAHDNVYLLLFGTGLRRSPQADVQASIGDLNAEVAFAGAQRDFAGLDQVTLVLPRELNGRGEVSLALLVDDQKANPVTLKVR